MAEYIFFSFTNDLLFHNVLKQTGIMKHASFLLILYIALVQEGFAQLQIWGASTNSDFTNEATALAFDNNNNLYVTGYITGETAFAQNVAFNSAQGNGDIYVAKYAPFGNLLWVKKFGGQMSDRAYDIKVDNNGDIVVSGQFFGSVNFGGTVLQSVANSKDIFVLKLNPQGDVLWALAEGGNLGDNMYALAVDQQNNIILTGQFAGSANIAGQNFVSQTNPDLNQPSYDLFVAKYNSSGIPLWALHGAAKYEDRGMALGTDNQNNIYIAGQFSDTLQFAGQTFNNSGYNIGFLAKLDANGQIHWFNRITGGMVLPYDLVVGADNQISLCGDFLGNLIHHTSTGIQTLSNSFEKKIFVSTVNSSGNVIWQRALGSDSEISARGIARDNNNQIYVTGHFRCALTELQQNNTALFNSVGFRDIYLWTLSAAGTSLQTKQMGGRKNDYAYDIQVNNFGQPFICGSFINHLFTPHSANNFSQPNYGFFSLNSNLHTDYNHFIGDESVNSFVSNALNTQTQDYNYFFNNSLDSLFGYISITDTLEFCVSGTIGYQPLTDNIVGPDYNFLWNNGAIEQAIGVNSNGDYWVNVSRVDNCVSHADTVHVVIHDLPELPLLSDDFPLYNLANLNNIFYHYCPPHDFNIWFNQLQPNTTIEINGPQTFHTDTLPHPYQFAGLYSVLIENAYCSNSGYFTILHDSIYDKEIDPLPEFVDTNIINDTLILCFGDWSPIQVIDLLTNPQMDFSITPTTNIVTEIFDIVCDGVQIPVNNNEYHASFQGIMTGWYVLTYTLVTGYDNLCGIDTLFNQRFDSLYVIVNPLPDTLINISYSSLLCPFGSVFITTDVVIPGFNWFGSAIDWISPGQDSVQVSSGGFYYYGGILIDPITGCFKEIFEGVQLLEKVPPTVSILPEDAIICPYDSVMFSVPSNFVSYNWTGPSGTNLSSTPTHQDAEMGFYYCTVLDDDGCYLTTPPVEIKEYATPYLLVEPTQVLCPGQQIQIQAIFNGTGQVQWLPPLSGSSPIQVVNQPGWYAAQITSCGITIIDSVLILDGSFSPFISASDTLLCFEQEIIITANTPNIYYEWNNGISGVSTIQVNQPGVYFALATNSFGCTSQTNVISITPVLSSIAPTSYSITLCNPGDITLETNENLIALWFDSDMSLLDSALTYTHFFDTSTTIFVAFPQEYCPLAFGTIEVILLDPITPNIVIQGDSSLCYYENSIYTVEWPGDVSWSLNGHFLGIQSMMSLNASNLEPYNLLSATIQNDCHNLVIQQEIVVHQQIPLTPSFYDTLLCPHQSLSLTFMGYLAEIYDLNSGSVSSGNSIQINGLTQSNAFHYAALDSNGCFTDTVSVHIQVFNLDFSIIEVFTPLCAPESAIFTTNVGLPVNWAINSNHFVADTLHLPIALAGDYQLATQFVDSLGCVRSDSLIFSVYTPTEISLTDTLVCIGEIVYNAFDFSNTDTPILIPTDSITVHNTQLVNYVIQNSYGCISQGQIQVEAINCHGEIPNVITPNGDGSNDFFIIKTALLEPNNHLVVMNRWGNVVFEEFGYQNTFNGENCIDGVYFYTYSPDRKGPQDKIQRGFLQIIRGQ